MKKTPYSAPKAECDVYSYLRFRSSFPYGWYGLALPRWLVGLLRCLDSFKASMRYGTLGRMPFSHQQYLYEIPLRGVKFCFAE